MTTFATWLFLGSMFLASVPLVILSYFLWKHWSPGREDVHTLGRTILYLTITKIIFYIAQFTSVGLGVLGWSMVARTPIIFMIDGSLILVMLANWYTFYKVWQIERGDISK